MKRLVIDTNLLVLLIVGSLDPGKIGCRRLEQFSVSHFEALLNFAADYRFHISTPNILTEASNLIGSGRQQLATGAAERLGSFIAGLQEIYVPSIECAHTRFYSELGLADAGLAVLAQRGDVVLTQDGPMYGMLVHHDLMVVNFWHMVKL